jgi:hypothetical protein
VGQRNGQLLDSRLTRGAAHGRQLLFHHQPAGGRQRGGEVARRLNGADHTAKFSPGMILSLFGTDLAGTLVIAKPRLYIKELSGSFTPSAGGAPTMFIADLTNARPGEPAIELNFEKP